MLSYWVYSPLEMVGKHLLGSRPAVDVLKHFLQEIYRFAYFDVVARLPCRVFDCPVLPPKMYLFLHRGYSTG
jgi:hypothetical protein